MSDVFSELNSAPPLVELGQRHERAEVLTDQRAVIITAHVIAHGKCADGALVVEGGERKLLEVVHALRATRGLASRLHGREQQRDQDGDDGNHDQKLNEREASTVGNDVSHEMLLHRVVKRDDID